MEPDDLSIARVLHALGQFVQVAGQPGQAEASYIRELESKEAKMSLISVANRLYAFGCCVQEVGCCVLEVGRPGAAEAFFKRALEIRDENTEPIDVSGPEATNALGRCFRQV